MHIPHCPATLLNKTITKRVRLTLHLQAFGRLAFIWIEGNITIYIWMKEGNTIYFAVYKERLNEWTNIQFIHALVCDENDNNNEDEDEDDDEDGVWLPGSSGWCHGSYRAVFQLSAIVEL